MDQRTMWRKVERSGKWEYEQSAQIDVDGKVLFVGTTKGPKGSLTMGPVVMTFGELESLYLRTKSHVTE